MSTGPESRLRELGITLPAPPVPGGTYVPAKTVSHMVYLSGVVSADASGLVTGAIGLDRTIEEGYAAARLCALTQLAVLQKHLGASDLFVEVFGDSGRHVRAAIGVSALPRNALVELQITVEI
jgi:enamine deaminase RidA (YjgF/YER057c/UK114 family)